ncbi:MAG: hypothetical protein WKF37_15510 [Bryobacteraceae bacterium]
MRRHSDGHIHTHSHDGITHSHVHFHEPGTDQEDSAAHHRHALIRVGLKPLLIGAMHGLAGSAALTVLVLTQVRSVALGLSYLVVFGIGSILGMLAVSVAIGLPFALSARRLTGIVVGLQAATGLAGIAFGFWYAYRVGLMVFG